MSIRYSCWKNDNVGLEGSNIYVFEINIQVADKNMHDYI